jgi:transposase
VAAAPLTREEIIALCAAAPEQVADLVLALYARVQALEERVRELERRLGLNSSNSGKPPSSDGYQKPAPKSLRGKSGRPSGGQPGHPGHRLEFREHPDHVVVHRPDVCRGCGNGLPAGSSGESVDRRQVFELVARVEVTEHQVHAVRCACCGEVSRGAFPPTVSAPTQYGTGMKAFAVYANEYQLLPTERISELICELTGHRLSEGTLYNLSADLSTALEPFVMRTRELLAAAPVAHFDESGVRVQGKLQWAHSASTATLTAYAIHPKRGEQAMVEAGILPAFSGVAIHDSWGPYWTFPCGHALCNVHHLRALQAVLDLDGQPWAKTMGDFLLSAEQAVHSALAAGQDRLPAEQLTALEAQYDGLIEQGLAAIPLPDPPPVPRRGQLKKSKARNLVERLQLRKDAALRFLHDFRVPFSNNQAERDIRMVKVQQKISGTFRSEDAAADFCRIRGYISTVKKHGLPVLDCLRRALEGRPFLPAVAAADASDDQPARDPAPSFPQGRALLAPAAASP